MYITIKECQHLRNIMKIFNLTQLRQLSYPSDGSIPVIRLPKYLENNLGNSIYKEHQKSKKKLKKQVNFDSEHGNKLIISSSDNKLLNHYYGYRYDKDQMKLVSKKWLSSSSNGERMTFHNFSDNPSLIKKMEQHNRTFESLELDPKIIDSIYQLVNNGFPIAPSSIQYGSIPLILNHKNVLFSAETGSGKTIAYLAPIIQLIDKQKRLNGDTMKNSKYPYGFVLLPSRELAEQVGNVAHKLASSTNVGVSTMVGGLPRHLTATGFDLIISTVGLVNSHLSQGLYSLRKLNHIVLDEADTLLDDSFSYEVMGILENVNLKAGQNEENVFGGTQLICSSATLPTTLESTIGSVLNFNEDVEQLTTKTLHYLHSNIKHIFYRLNKYDKDLKLIELLKESKIRNKPTMVFANRSTAVYWLYKFLNENDFPCVILSSDISEEERFLSLKRFQDGEFDFLVSTDLGSRGLDTTRVRHVINFDCPHYVSDYIHRSGRTGRLGTKGSCLVSTLLSFKQDIYMLMELERSLRLGKEISVVNANIKSQIQQRWADKRNKIQRDLEYKKKKTQK